MSRLEKELADAAVLLTEQSSTITYGTVGIKEYPHHRTQEEEATQKEQGATSFFCRYTENYYKIMHFSQA